jgi:toxin ParE1/3/4
MPVILKRPRAVDDLIELWEYIADDNVARADAFIDDVDAKFHLLAEQPMLGRSREELAPGLRSFPLGRYVIFYEVIPDGIAIVRVLHGARDLGPLFESE